MDNYGGFVFDPSDGKKNMKILIVKIQSLF
jgi:hypothetical protein